MYFSFLFADSGHPTTARRPGLGTSADGGGWAAPPAPTSHSQFLVLPTRRQSQVLPISPGALRWTGEESPAPAQSPLPIISLLQRPLAQGIQLTACGARSAPRVRGPGWTPGKRTVPAAACGGREEAIRRGPAQTSTVQPLACEKKARNLIRGRSRPKFQPQRGVTGSRPTGARQPAALSPFPSSFGSPGRRKHGESLTRRETSSCRTATHHPAQASLCPAHAAKLGSQVAPLAGRGAPASDARIVLSPRVPEPDQPEGSQAWAGRFLRLAARSPRVPQSHPRPTGPTEGRPLSLSLVSPCAAPELGRWARGCEGRKGLRGHRWLQIGADPKCSEQGAVSPGLTVEEPATEPPEPPPGFLGPGATLPGAPRPSSPHSLSAPLSLSGGTLSRSP